MMRTLLLVGVIMLGLPWGVMAQGAADGAPSMGPTSTPRKAAFRVLFNFDFRRTFVDGEPVRFYGFRLGAQRGKDIVAAGLYGLGDPYVREDVELEGVGTRDLRTNFDFAGISYERLLLDAKRWQIGIPFVVGLGNYRTSYQDSLRTTRTWSSNELVPIEASLHVDYNLLWWLFFGVGGGYRHVIAAERDVTVSLSDWTYYFKAGLRVGEIMKRARKELRRTNGS